MRRPSRPRTPATLCDATQQRLNSYALAAAGVGMLALSQPADGRIIYTSTHKTIKVHQHDHLDLNHDRITDFTIQLTTFHTRGTSAFTTLEVLPSKNNAVEGGYLNSSCGTSPSAFALPFKALIGPKQPFHGKSPIMAFAGTIDGGSVQCGPWLSVKDRYLGLKFQIHGTTHYGWARLSVVNTEFSINSATLTGYAYETIPNKPITAGRTKAPDEIDNRVEQPNPVTLPTSRQATLGLLAIGSPALPRRQRQ